MIYIKETEAKNWSHVVYFEVCKFPCKSNLPADIEQFMECAFQQVI